MYPDAEERLKADPELYRLYVENDYKLPEDVDTRITRIGRFLRRTSLDELPQLWNVLRGDMSLVGPRPIVPDEIRHYNGEAPLLLTLKPGITGAWQVNGRSALQYPERATVELEYVERWSLMSDLAILARTIPAVLARRGAH
jgi:lipopolysaccharide/colanic/teichoic acid biosynthesis glycosyltransferase